MSKSMVGPTGGLSATDKTKLIPENIRKGVTICGVTGVYDGIDDGSFVQLNGQGAASLWGSTAYANTISSQAGSKMGDVSGNGFRLSKEGKYKVECSGGSYGTGSLTLKLYVNSSATTITNPYVTERSFAAGDILVLEVAKSGGENVVGASASMKITRTGN